MSKSLLIVVAIIFFTLFLSVNSSFAESPQVNEFSDNHTAREEAEGKEIWERLQAKQLECKDLTDESYDSLGEYFMGQSIGDTQRHALMNQMTISMMGEEGEKQMHIVMGKRLSGCDTSAEFPQSGVKGMGGGGNPMMGYGWNPMMSGWGGFSVLFFNLSLIVWLIVGILAAVWLFRQINKK